MRTNRAGVYSLKTHTKVLHSKDSQLPAGYFAAPGSMGSVPVGRWTR